jgi:2-succinyl-6-hydroxy-2,4-cyclohexadiene-1-carboxylate synthase
MGRSSAATKPVPLAAEAMYPARDATATASWVTLADGERVRVVHTGPPDAPPVVFLHGWACSAFAWRHLVGPIVAHGYRTVALDLRGHGLSDRPADPAKYTRAAMVAHCVETLDVLGVARAPVVAHSMGGAVAMALAMAQPERVTRLALFGAVGFGMVDRAAWSQLLPPSLTGRLLPMRIPRWAVKFALKHSRGEAGVSDGEEEVDEYWAPTQYPEFLNAMRLLLHEFTWEPWTPTQLAEVHQPVLLLFGDRDPVVKPQRVVPTLARVVPSAELHVAERAGHVLHEERPEWSLERVLPFLQADRALVR